MNEMRVPQPEQIAAAPPPSRRADPLRRWTLVILVLFVVLFGWTLIADRLTPYTSDASVRAFVVRIVPEVSGKVVEHHLRLGLIHRCCGRADGLPGSGELGLGTLHGDAERPLPEREAA